MANKTIPFFLIPIVLICYPGSSAGFLNNNQDAVATAMGNCFAAVADNPSAVFYNPAGINQLEGTQLRSSCHFVLPNTSFRGSESGKRTDMDDDISFLSSGYLTHQVNDTISLGGGIFIPFALDSEWPSRWEGETLYTYAEFTTFCVNPVVSVQVHPRLSLAVGIDYLYSDFKIRRVVNPNQLIGIPLGIPSGKVTLEGFDDTWGYNLGLLFSLNDRWNLGISYRSEFKLEFDGHAHFHLPPLIKALYPPTDISPRTELPRTVSAELSTQVWDKWTFTAGIRWTNWSVIDEYALKLRDNLLVPPTMQYHPQDWRDVIDFHLGVQYQLNPTWVLRGGYTFDKSPVPEHTLSPMVPDSDGHLLSLGIGYKRANFVIDLAWMASLFKDRHTRRNLDGLNGKYTSTAISFLISATYYFQGNSP